MDRISYRLTDPQRANQVLRDVWSIIKPVLMAGHALALEIKPETRSGAENRLLHAMISHIAKKQTWAGSKHDTEVWKRLLIAAWCRAHGEQVKILPALDGCGVDIVFRRSSQLTRAECADLIEFVFAWGADNDVQFPPDPRLGYDELV